MIASIKEVIQKGGLVMIPIILLSLVLYSRCFKLLLAGLPVFRACTGPAQTHGLSFDRKRLLEDFQRQRISLGAMIAAAPLLGLLGTVAGMVTTFEHLASNEGHKSMEGLAGGISEVLTATQAGLAVALPAMLLLYFIHWKTQRELARLTPRGTTFGSHP